MTIEKVFRLFERIKPNALDMEQKLQFINEVEGKVQTDVMLLSPADVIVYDESMLTYTLLARPPHDKIYVAYLVAMTDYAIGEYNKYDTTIALYNDYMDEYKAWYAMTYRPADGEMKALGYYLSAYAIAVAHGFTGTEEQWLASLIGQRGLSDYDIAVRLGYEGTERDWVASLKGDKGDAFTYDDFTPEQLAALRGNPFTYEDFTPEQLAALQGDNGADAYELAVANGFVGTLEEWLLSLRDTTAVQPDVLGKPGGVATLDGGGTVPMSQVPILPIDRVAGLTAILSDAMGVSGRVMSGEYVGGGGEYVYELSGESHATDAYNATSPTATFVSKSPRVIEFPFEPDMVFIVEGNTIKKLLPGSSSAIRVAINIPASWGDGEVTTSAAAVQNVPRVVFTGSRLEFYSNVRFTGSFEHTDNQGVTSTIDASELDRRYYDQGSSTLPGQGTISSIPNASGTVYQFIAFEHAAPNDYKTYGVDIDQTDEDSDAAVSYTDDAVSIPAGNAVWDHMPLFKDIRPCVMRPGFLRVRDLNASQRGIWFNSGVTLTPGTYSFSFDIRVSEAETDANYTAYPWRDAEKSAMSVRSYMCNPGNINTGHYAVYDPVNLLDNLNSSGAVVGKEVVIGREWVRYTEAIEVDRDTLAIFKIGGGTGGEKDSHGFDIDNVKLVRVADGVETGENMLRNGDLSAPVTVKDLGALSQTAADVGWYQRLAGQSAYTTTLTHMGGKRYLDPYDYTKDVNGDAIALDGSTGDVFVEVPKLGVKIETVNDVVKVRVTNDPDAGGRGYHYYAHTRVTEGDCDYLYLSVYPGAVIDGKLRSVSGVPPTLNVSLADMREYARANGEGYDLMSFHAVTLIQCLMLIKHKSLRMNHWLGDGYRDMENFVTGELNGVGMFHGEDDSLDHNKAFGMEDLWGGFRWFVDGVYSGGGTSTGADSGTRNIGTAFDGFNDTGEGYTYHPTVTVENSGGYMSAVQGTTELGFIMKEGNGSATTFFRGQSALNVSANPVMMGSIFVIWFSPYGADAAASRGARLMYLKNN